MITTDLRQKNYGGRNYFWCSAVSERSSQWLLDLVTVIVEGYCFAEKCYHTDINLLKAVNVTHFTLQWHHNEHNGISNRQHLDCLLNRLFRRRSKKTSKLHVTGLCDGNPPVTSGFPSQRVSNTENVSIWWRHHVTSHEDELPWLTFRVNLFVFCNDTNVA